MSSTSGLLRWLDKRWKLWGGGGGGERSRSNGSCVSSPLVTNAISVTKFQSVTESTRVSTIPQFLCFVPLSLCKQNESGLIYNLHLLSLMHVFTFKQLHSATGGFSKSNVVGHGGFGLVYRGLLNNGRKVAIKFIDNAGNQGEEEFKMEVCCSLFELLVFV